MLNDNRIRRLLTAAVLVAAASFPAAAQAKYDLNPPRLPGQVVAAQVSPTAPQPGPTTSSGFKWVDAGAGAAAILVLLGAGTAAVGGARRRARLVRDGRRGPGRTAGA